jgi:PAS domain-containing protein
MVDTDLRIVRINRLVAAALNRPAEELRGLKLGRLLLPSMRDQVVPLFERILRTGEPVLDVIVRGALVGSPEREYVWLMNQHPVTGKDGEVQAILSVAQNITPLVRQQDELEETRRRLEEAQRMARVGSWEWNIIDDAMWWSEELFSITGTDPATFEPSWDNFFELVLFEDRPKVRAQLDATLQRNDQYWVEFRIALPNAKERLLRCCAKLDRTTKGIPARLFGTCQDITEVGSAPRV